MVAEGAPTKKILSISASLSATVPWHSPETRIMPSTPCLKAGTQSGLSAVAVPGSPRVGASASMPRRKALSPISLSFIPICENRSLS